MSHEYNQTLEGRIAWQKQLDVQRAQKNAIRDEIRHDPSSGRIGNAAVALVAFVVGYAFMAFLPAAQQNQVLTETRAVLTVFLSDAWVHSCG
jgi:hypothetical protein